MFVQIASWIAGDGETDDFDEVRVIIVDVRRTWKERRTFRYTMPIFLVPSVSLGMLNWWLSHSVAPDRQSLWT